MAIDLPRRPRNARRSEPRSATELIGGLRRRVRADAGLYNYPAGVERPRTRGDCADGPRPCPWVACRFHLFLDALETGSVKINFPKLDVDEIPATCALDVADEGGVTLDVLGQLVNVTRERARQIQDRALAKLEQATKGRAG